MTTYPLSERATIYAMQGAEVDLDREVGQGTLAECADIIDELPADQQQSVAIHMNELDLRFGPKEITELMTFLREEDGGLTNNEIKELKSSEG